MTVHAADSENTGNILINQSHNATSSHQQHDRCAAVVGKCEDGLIIPRWTPEPAEIPVTDRVGRAFVYIFGMAYIFLGVSIVADKFVTAIEVIVSKIRKVKIVSKVTGSETYVHVPIWNETVAHLTLFVLGNCAPEIMLSAIEIISRDFKEGELGPGTIIGSGAYNLFVITGICCVSVPNGRTLRLHELRIFFVAAFWLIFAYLWLYLILKGSSEGIVEVWEAFLTLGFYPIFVTTAYLADKRCFGFFDHCKKLRWSSKVAPSSAFNSQSSGEQLESTAPEEHQPKSAIERAVAALERREKRFLQIMSDVKRKHPNATMAQQRELAELEILKEEPKSLNYYRMAASRRMAGGSVINKEKLREKIAADENSKKAYTDPNGQEISFDPVKYFVMENAGTFRVHVIREGANLNNAISVGYETEDGTGKAGEDYKRTSGRITFKNNETLKEIPIQIIDDDEFNMDTQFYVRLLNPNVVTSGLANQIHLTVKGDGLAKITKLDDDHGGIFSFDSSEVTVHEGCGYASIKVVRNSGAKGDVKLPIVFKPLTARPAIDYDDSEVKGLIFQNGETESVARIRIIDQNLLTSKRLTLELELGEPEWTTAEKRPPKTGRQFSKSFTSVVGGRSLRDPAPPVNLSKLGRPRLGDIKTVLVAITENPELKQAVNDLANTEMTNLMGSCSWPDQFRDALAIPNGGDDEDDQFGDSSLEKDVTSDVKRSWKDYVSHVITMFWKIIFAFIPPPGIGEGWPAFFVCLVYIGFLIAIIGDLAVYLGCTIGLKDEITAITLVSLGTSLPDMFASRIAAKHEKTADSAIGHVTGSCAANIFLGIGLSWSIGSIKQALDGNAGLTIQPGSLSFSITLFFSLGSVALFVLLIRRLPPIRGELGGKPAPKFLTAIVLWLLWLLYVGLSALDSYCLIKTF